MKSLHLTFLIGIFLFFNLTSLSAKEAALPSFKITGYIEKINSDSIQVFVPRMKKSLSLLLDENVLVAEFANPEKKSSLNILREKDMAVFEGIINKSGFVCQAIYFVRSA